MNTLRRICQTVLACAWFAGCGSPLVGLECRDGYEQCEDGCYDLTSDPSHCGGCDLACGPGELCAAAACVPEGTADGGLDAGDDGGADAQSDGGPDLDGSTDGASLDSALADAARDADASGGDGGDASLPGDAGDGAAEDAGEGGSELDANTGDEAGTDDGGRDAGPPICTGHGSPEDCICEVGQRKCGLRCVDPNTDPANCGECGTTCQFDELCSSGVCSDLCVPPLSFCDGLCFNLQDDDLHCGSCTIACGPSSACITGLCVGNPVGHVIVIGHDMTSVTRAPMRRMVGNAVFNIVSGSPLRVLVYDADTSAATRDAISSIIQTQAFELGRNYVQSSTTAELASSLLSTSDVFVIEPQQGASDQELVDVGTSWSAALASFLARGGVVLLFDAGGGNAGSYQILRAAGLFDAAARIAIAPGVLRVVAPADTVGAGVQTPYPSEGETAVFDLADDPNRRVVVEDPNTMLPVVLHDARVW